MLTVETLLSSTDTIPYSELRALVGGDRKITGPDVVAALQKQQDRRRDEAQALLKTAQDAGRDLLASENRTFDRAMAEANQIGELVADVERRTADGYRVPRAVAHGGADDSEPSAVLRSNQSVAEWARRTQGAPTFRPFALGRIVRAIAFGDRRGMNDLELRAQAEGSDSAGGFTVDTPLSASFIDRMRDAMVIYKLGAMLVPMTSETLSIARLSADGATMSSSPSVKAPEWKAENDPIDEASIVLERVRFTAKTLPMLMRMSVELAEDSLNIDQVIEQEMAQGMARALQAAALLGDGSGATPTGILHQSGVDVQSLSGVSIDYDKIIDSAAVVASFNHVPNGVAYNSDAAKTLAKLRGVVNDQYLLPPRYLDTIPPAVTNAIATSGSPAESSFIVGAWQNLMIGMRTSFRLEVSREANGAFKNLQLVVRAYLRADVQLSHGSAFAVRTDVGV